MIVFDASALVSAALKVNGAPERAFLHAVRVEVFALSHPVWDEVTEVFARRKFDATILPARRIFILDLLLTKASWFKPTISVRDCRDPGDNKYLELALAAAAQMIVSGDKDLLALHPWRGVQILAPSRYLSSLLHRP